MQVGGEIIADASVCIRVASSAVGIGTWGGGIEWNQEFNGLYYSIAGRDGCIVGSINSGITAWYDLYLKLGFYSFTSINDSHRSVSGNVRGCGCVEVVRDKHLGFLWTIRVTTSAFCILVWVRGAWVFYALHGI